MRTAAIFAMLLVGCATRSSQPPVTTTAVIGVSMRRPTPEERAWAEYNRGVIFVDPDKAAAAFDEAARQFANVPDGFHGRAISLYGKARAFHDANRCEEALAAYREYADFVRATHPEDAAMALEYARDCRPPLKSGPNSASP